MFFQTKTIISVIIGIGLIWNVQGQNGQINGTVFEKEEPLAYATVILKNLKDSSIVKAAVTMEDGRFSFSGIPYATYFIETSFVGLQSFQSGPFLLETEIFKMDPIILQPASTELEAVEVVSARPLIEVFADKTVFNVENSLNSTGTNSFELLRKAPGVIIDNNDNVILEGKTGVLIYINGKPSPLSGADLTNYLSALQSSDIEAIELITQPSSKYDAAGNAGIINIRLKKDKRLGTNGTLSGGYAYGKNSRNNSSVSINNRTRKTNFFGTYNNSFGDTWSFLNLNRIQQNVRYDSKTETLNNKKVNNARIGMDFFPHANHTIGVLLDGNFFRGNSDGLTKTPITPLTMTQVDQILIAKNESVNESYNLLGNLNYRFADTLGHELMFDIDYGKYNRDRTSYQPNEYLDGSGENLLFERNYRMITPTVIDINTVKMDYSQKLFGTQFSIGGKYSKVKTDNTFEFYDVIDDTNYLNENRSNRFIYDENINAAYVNLNKKWSKWNAQIGLRVEQTISEGNLLSIQSSDDDKVKRNYTDWFPSGGITYSPNQKNSWTINYSRRIQRPNYQSLNPFEYQIDELSFSKGNPFLQPQYTDNIKLSHTYNYRLTTSLSYSHISDFFAKVTDTLGTTKNFLITRNIANQNIWSLSVSYPFEVAKWWSVYASLNAYHASYQGNDEKFKSIDQSTVSFYGQNTFSLPKGFKLEVSGWFSSPSVWGGTYLTKSLGSMDIAIQKKILENRLSFRLSFSDIFYTSNWRADMEFGGLNITGSGGWESRQIRFNVSYAFGSQEVKKSRKRNTGLEEEGQRIGGD